MVQKYAGLALAVMLLAACQATGRGNFCDVAEPIRPSAGTLAAMSDAEVADALRQNRVGEELCGWRQ